MHYTFYYIYVSLFFYKEAIKKFLLNYKSRTTQIYRGEL